MNTGKKLQILDGKVQSDTTTTMGTEKLEIFCNDKPVGVLEKESRGYDTAFRFRYHESASEDQAVSLTMPTVERIYEGFRDLPDALQVSLPEGAVAQHLVDRFGKGVRLSDKFALLKLVGRNMTGRITAGGVRTPFTLEKRLLEMAGAGGQTGWAQNILESAGKNGFGVSGVMPKLLVSETSTSGFGDPYRAFSESILKMERSPHFGVCVAEHFALTASRNAGIPTVNAYLNHCGDALFIQRFDIQDDGSRRGFEDACVLTGFSPVFKYDGCLEKLFIMIEGFVEEAHVTEDKTRLLRMLFLNDILRNGDAHLKNFGLIYTNPGDVRLAPSYDVLDTTLFLPADIPALTIRQFFPDEAPQHKRWMTESDIDELVDVADLPLVNGWQMRKEILDSVWDSSAAYRRFLNTSSLTADHRAFGARMLDALEARLRSLRPASAQRGTAVPKDIGDDTDHPAGDPR